MAIQNIATANANAPVAGRLFQDTTPIIIEKGIPIVINKTQYHISNYK